jgi:ribonucleotide reductase beta subunit family protein with ferritin-like domain
MNNISELALNYLQRYNCQFSEDYQNILREACETYPPPHGMAWYGNLYRQCARQVDWFSHSLITNAAEEGEGARGVWKFSHRIENSEIAELVRNHAIDESRHSKMFVSLLNILFPTKIEAEFRNKLQAFSPEYYPHKHPLIEQPTSDNLANEKQVMDEIIQINILEIRALVLQLLLRPVLQAYAQPEDLAKVTQMSDVLIFDETKHIEYSSYCIGKYIQQGHKEWVRERMLEQQYTINEMFLEDVEWESLGKTVLTIN